MYLKVLRFESVVVTFKMWHPLIYRHIFHHSYNELHHVEQNYPAVLSDNDL